jgi:hypothetical protein
MREESTVFLIAFSDDELHTLPPAVRTAVLSRLQPPPPAEAAPDAKNVALEVERPADLSEDQAAAFLEGCSEKTIQVLRGIIAAGSREFRLSALPRMLNLMSINELGNVWGGLTKRTQTILGRKAKIIAFQNHYDEQHKWKDATGRLSEQTFESLRRALGIKP